MSGSPSHTSPGRVATRPVDRLLAEYGASHRNPTNKLIHWIAVPAIFWCALALLSELPGSPPRSGSFRGSVSGPSSRQCWRRSTTWPFGAVGLGIGGVHSHLPRAHPYPPREPLSGLAVCAHDLRGCVGVPVLHRPCHRGPAPIVLQGRTVPVDRACMADVIPVPRRGVGSWTAQNVTAWS